MKYIHSSNETQFLLGEKSLGLSAELFKVQGQVRFTVSRIESPRVEIISVSDYYICAEMWFSPAEFPPSHSLAGAQQPQVEWSSVYTTPL
jgi:hypothetical protein